MIVQEAPRRFRWRTKCAELAHSWGMVYAAGGLPALGNLIVTTQRVRVHQTWCLRYPLTPGRHLRGAAFARCSVAGPDGHELTFVVAGTHLATDDTERPGQARAFTEAVKAITDPAIVGLDANETPGGPSWTVVANGLTDAAVACGDARPTFPAAHPTRRLDAVFVDPRLDCHRVRRDRYRNRGCGERSLAGVGRGSAGGLRLSVRANAFDLARF